ncbi:MAG: HAMP domain-containing histidine kinase [Myxococcaceae bacterium]|nr:HAMP domain-containing histidine kinase [Myxococcaceae bacterium]
MMLTTAYLGVFSATFGRLGTMGGALAVLPVAAAALAFGLRAGTGVALAVAGLTSLARLVLDAQAALFDGQTFVGVLSLVVVAAGVGFARDLSVRLARQERELTRSKAELTALIDAIPDTLVRVDEAMVVRSAWRLDLMRGACLRTPSVGCAIADCGRPEVLATLEPLLRQAAPGVTPSVELEITDEGTKKYVEARVSVTSAGDRLLVFRDVTPARELQVRLLAAERGRALAEAQAQIDQAQRLASLGTLAAGIGHEINNPLTYLVSVIELLARELAKPQADGRRVTDMLAGARTSAHRIAGIVRDMQMLSRSGSGERAAPFDVARAVTAAANLASVALRERARLEVDVERAPAVLGFEGRLSQVLLNLIVNAAQAMPNRPLEQNRIVVSARADHDGRTVRLSVDDNGSGMTDEVIAQAFDPFFTTKPAGEGTGLGLAISRSLVEKMGGSLTVTSAPGVGSTFTLSLPTA